MIQWNCEPCIIVKLRIILELFTANSFQMMYSLRIGLVAVKAQIYHLLGVFAEVYPELMINYSEKLLDLYIRTLREQVMQEHHLHLTEFLLK